MVTVQLSSWAKIGWAATLSSPSAERRLALGIVRESIMIVRKQHRARKHKWKMPSGRAARTAHTNVRGDGNDNPTFDSFNPVNA
jgi:hypothetical protein